MREVETYLQMCLTFLSLCVPALFFLIAFPFPTLLQFSASIFLHTLIRSTDLREQPGISLRVTQSLTQSSLEKGRDWQRSTAENHLDPLTAPLPDALNSGCNPSMSFPYPGPASANRIWLRGLFELTCTVLVHVALSM